MLAQVLVVVQVEGRSCSYGLGMVLQQARKCDLVLVDDLNSAWYILLFGTVYEVLSFEIVVVQCWATEEERVVDPNRSVALVTVLV